MSGDNMLRKLIILFSLGIFFLAFLAAGPFFSRPAAIGFFVLFLLVAAVSSFHLLPAKTLAGWEGKRCRFRATVFLCLLLFSFGGLAMNFYLLPGMFRPLSLIGDLGLLILVFLLFRTLMKLGAIRQLAAGLILFTLLLAIVSLLSPAGAGGRTGRAGRDLLALPYLATARAADNPSAAGVTVYDRSRAERGYNLYVPWIRAEAYLIDMEGETVHRWEIKLGDGDTVFHVELGDNGALFAITRSGQLRRLDRDSNLLWTRDLGAHHDLTRNEAGDLLVLTQENQIVRHRGRPLPILNNHLAVVSAEGDLRQRFSLFEMLQDNLPPETTGRVFAWWLGMYKSPRAAIRTVSNTLLKLVGGYRFTYYDLFHANTIRIARRDIEGVAKKGDWLICSRTLDMVAVIDPDGLTARWTWGPGTLDKPHAPGLLENGNLLVFDNGAARGYSRVIEVDPRSGEIVWGYAADNPEDFYTEWRGSCQKLPGGNVLITESDRGRVFEVTPEGEIVWEFFCPFRDEEKNERSAIYRLERIFDLSLLSFLDLPPSSGPEITDSRRRGRR